MTQRCSNGKRAPGPVYPRAKHCNVRGILWCVAAVLCASMADFAQAHDDTSVSPRGSAGGPVDGMESGLGSARRLQSSSDNCWIQKSSTVGNSFQGLGGKYRSESNTMCRGGDWKSASYMGTQTGPQCQKLCDQDPMCKGWDSTISGGTNARTNAHTHVCTRWW